MNLYGDLIDAIHYKNVKVIDYHQVMSFAIKESIPILTEGITGIELDKTLRELKVSFMLLMYKL